MKFRLLRTTYSVARFLCNGEASEITSCRLRKMRTNKLTDYV